LFWGFYNKVKTSNHKELVIILGNGRKQNTVKNTLLNAEYAGKDRYIS